MLATAFEQQCNADVLLKALPGDTLRPAYAAWRLGSATDETDHLQQDGARCVPA
jgi:hypothetical protein